MALLQMPKHKLLAWQVWRIYPGPLRQMPLSIFQNQVQSYTSLGCQPLFEFGILYGLILRAQDISVMSIYEVAATTVLLTIIILE